MFEEHEAKGEVAFICVEDVIWTEGTFLPSTSQEAHKLNS